MIGRRAVVTLSLLSALLFCAFAAQSASAILVTKSTNTTGFTCVEVAKTGDFEDAHCDKGDPQSDGNFEHKLLPIGSTTELDATNQKVTNETKNSEPILIKGEVGLSKVEIECTTMKTISPKSAVHNVEPEAGKHTFTGNGEAEFSECVVKLIGKCVVREPIIASANFHGVDNFTGPNGEANAMGVEFVGAGGGETFGNIEFLNKGAEACAVNKQSFAVSGRAIGTSGPTTTSAQNNKATGATIVFNEKAQTLKLGPKAASVKLITTPTGKGGPPVSITTTT
jgi:hypothetical protein